jgi:nucleotide-binding universal stress UspA family protein
LEGERRRAFSPMLSRRLILRQEERAGVRRLLSLTIGLGALLGSGTADAAIDCSGLTLPEPTIRVRAQETPDPPVDRTLNVVELTQQAQKAGSTHGQATRVVGLTTVEFRFTIETLRVAGIPKGNRICAVPIEIDIELAALQSVFVVAASHANPCWDAAILEHEMQHVAFNNAAVRRAAATLDPEVQKLGRADPVAAKSLEEASQRYAKRIDRLVKAASKSALGEARKMHKSIDTPRAYIAVRRRCGV